MTKLRLFALSALICCLGLAAVAGARLGVVDIGAYAIGKAPSLNMASTTRPVPTPEIRDKKTEPLPEVPEHVKFRFLFQHVTKIKDKAGARQRYQDKTTLTDTAFSTLELLAVEHEQQAAVIDQQAKVIVDNLHAQYPRNLPPGMAPPPPPQELLDLEVQRNALALRYRDRVKAQLGDERYTNFKRFMDEEFAPKPRGGAATMPLVPPGRQHREER